MKSLSFIRHGVAAIAVMAAQAAHAETKIGAIFGTVTPGIGGKRRPHPHHFI